MSPTPPQLPHHVVPGTPARQTSLPLPGSARKSASSLHPLPAPSSQALRTFASTSRLERPFLPLETLELSSGSESEEETDRTQHQNPPSSSPDPVPIARPSVMGVTGAGQRIPSMAAYKSVPGQARRSAQVAASVRSRVDGTLGDGERILDVWRVSLSSPVSTMLKIVPPEVLSDVCVPFLLPLSHLYSRRCLPQCRRPQSCIGEGDEEGRGRAEGPGEERLEGVYLFLLPRAQTDAGYRRLSTN
jgi:hypothetical protein